jgi:hypothetical protein
MLVGGDPLFSWNCIIERPHYQGTRSQQKPFASPQDMIYTKPMIKNRMPIPLLILLGSLLSCAPEITPGASAAKLSGLPKELGRRPKGSGWPLAGMGR